MHLKRQKIPKNWPAYRKGTKYVAKPSSDTKRGVSTLMILRDMLKIVKNKKEAKRTLYLKKILLNERPVMDEKQSAVLFDVIKIDPLDKCYRLDLSDKGKIILTEIPKGESGKKIAKINNKTVLNGKKTQINLSDGRNFISDMSCKTNDSVVINFKDKKIEKCIPLKSDSEVIIFSGKHFGKRGIVKNIHKEKKMAEINSNGEIINVLIKQLMAIK